MNSPPKIALVMGSDSDLPVVEAGIEGLRHFGVPFVARVISAHRSPQATAEFARGAQASGLKVIIAFAGGAAHLAGCIAAHTTLPVLGVPVDATALSGVDALYATAQMPAGVPVATLAVGAPGAANAAILAVQILALSDPELNGKLAHYKEELEASVVAKDRRLQEQLGDGRA